MNILQSILVSTLTLAITACGSSSSDEQSASNEVLSSSHDGRYIVSIYNTEGSCIGDGDQAVIQVEGGVLVDSYYARSTISGTVSNGNVLEGWMERNGDTITFAGKFESTLTGNWRAEIGACGGYFEEYSREALPENKKLLCGPKAAQEKEAPSLYHGGRLASLIYSHAVSI